MGDGIGVEVFEEFFVQSVSQSLEEARRSGNLEHSSRLQQVLDAIEELTAPPAEFALIEELLEIAEDEAVLNSAVESHSEEMTPELIQMLNVLVTRTQASMDSAQGAEQNQQQEVLMQLQVVYNAVVGYSMRRNIEKG